METGTPRLIARKDGAVGWLIFNNPERRNAISSDMWQGIPGVVSAFDAVYFDVIPDERLIYAYEMRLDGRKISVSLATLTIAPDPKGALLTMSEQGVFLDGYDDAGSREHGTAWLLDQVEKSLSES